MQPMSTSDSNSTLNNINAAQNAAITPPPSQEIAISVNNNNANTFATPNALVPVATTESALNSLSSQVTVLQQQIKDGATSALENCVNCCCSPEAIIGYCLTAAAIAGLAPEVWFIVASYYCLNDPSALGSHCTKYKDKKGHVHHQSPHEAGAWYATAAAIYPLALSFIFCIWYLKKRRH